MLVQCANLAQTHLNKNYVVDVMDLFVQTVQQKRRDNLSRLFQIALIYFTRIRCIIPLK